MEKHVLTVAGMSCEHCVKAVTRAVESLPGVAGVAVALKGGSVSVRFDPEQTALKDIEAAITDAGYTVVA